MPVPSPSEARVASIAAWLMLAAALLSSAYVRGRYVDMPLERDEGEFAYSARLLLQGEPPYKHAYNIKLPGVDLVYAGFLGAFGDDARSIHVGLLLTGLATIVILWRLADDLFDPMTAGAAAWAYAMLSTSPAVVGTAAHATHFIALCTLIGVTAILRAVARESVSATFIAGLAFGTAVLMKQPALIFALLGLGMLLLPSYSSNEHATPMAGGRRSRGIVVAVYAAGVILPYAILLAWIWWHGVFSLFWEWTVIRARTWAGKVAIADALSACWLGTRTAIGPTWPPYAVAAVGLSGLAVTRRFPLRTRLTVLGFLAVACLATSAGFFFRRHYFILLLPAVSLCFGAGARILADAVSRLVRPSATSAAISILGVTLLALGSQAWLLWPFYGQWTPGEASRSIYGPNPFVESPAVGEYLRKHTLPDERIAVLGSEAQILFYARRTAATGHLFVYPMMTPGPDGDRAQREMIAEISRAKPAYIVYVKVATSWLGVPDSSDRLHRWAEEYIDRFYAIDGVIDIIGPGQTEYVWGDAAAAYAGRSPHQLHVYKRTCTAADSPSPHAAD